MQSLQQIQSQPGGKLIVTPKSANLKHDTEIFSKMDPYLIIKCGSQSKKSMVHVEGGKHPRWNMNFDLTSESILIITVMDKDMINDDVVGQVEIPLTTILQVKKTSSSYELKYKGKDAGLIYVDMEFYPNQNLGLPGAAATQLYQNVGAGVQQQYVQPQQQQAIHQQVNQGVYAQFQNPQPLQVQPPIATATQPLPQQEQQQQQKQQPQYYPSLNLPPSQAPVQPMPTYQQQQPQQQAPMSANYNYQQQNYAQQVPIQQHVQQHFQTQLAAPQYQYPQQQPYQMPPNGYPPYQQQQQPYPGMPQPAYPQQIQGQPPQGYPYQAQPQPYYNPYQQPPPRY